MVFSDGKLWLFGGLGIPSGPTQPGAEYSEDFVEKEDDDDDYRYTNELHVYDLSEGEGL